MKPSVGLMTPQDLTAALGNASVAVVDARTRDEYEGGHIPGAVWIGWESWCAVPPAELGPALAAPGYWGVVADRPIAEWERELSVLGLSNDEQIVVYADGLSSRGREGRIAWMLLYLGAERVSLLDGGWAGWLAGRHPVERRPAEPVAGRFAPVLRRSRLMGIDDLQPLHRAGRMPLMIDVRSSDEFAGACFQYMPRMGRIPGSVLLPFASLVGDDGLFVSRDRYRAMLPAEVRGAGRAAFYCEVGVRAALASVLHEIHTGEVVPVYDGSMMEWSARRELPVEGAPASRMDGHPMERAPLPEWSVHRNRPIAT